MRPLAVCLLLVAACLPDTSGFGEGKPDGATDGSVMDGAVEPTDGATLPDLRPSDAGMRDMPPRDAQVGPPMACRPTPLPCLDASDPDVIEVPTEAGAEAFEDASAGQTVQVRGLTLTSTFRIGPLVTVRGCAGASVDESGTLWPQGSGAIIEGFEIAGSVVMNKTGSYIVRDNVFADRTATADASIEARSVDALVSANVEVVVERNRFERVARAIGASTRYDTMTHRVTLTVRNNLFVDTDDAISISEGGLVGEIDATIAHNTFVGFDTAVRFTSMETRPRLEANLFAMGALGVATDSVYEGPNNMDWAVDEPHQAAPFGGSFVTIPEPFVDTAGGDYRLDPGSLAIDAYGGGDLTDDVVGCPRPVAFTADTPRYDVGAYEAQTP